MAMDTAFQIQVLPNSKGNYCPKLLTMNPCAFLPSRQLNIQENLSLVMLFSGNEILEYFFQSIVTKFTRFMIILREIVLLFFS